MDKINWVEHDGSDKCPVPEGVKFAIKFRNGSVDEEVNINPNCFRWHHDNHDDDITHYWYEGCEADKPKNSWEGRFQKLTREGYEWVIKEEFEGRYFGRAWDGKQWWPLSWDADTGKSYFSQNFDLLPIEPPKPVEVVRYNVCRMPEKGGYESLEEARQDVPDKTWHIQRHTFRNGKLVGVELVNEEDCK